MSGEELKVSLYSKVYFLYLQCLFLKQVRQYVAGAFLSHELDLNIATVLYKYIINTIFSYNIFFLLPFDSDDETANLCAFL